MADELREEALRAARDAASVMVIAFRRWHLDRHGYAPTVHDFRLMLDMATDANVLRRYRAAELTEAQAAQKLGLDRLSFRELDAATDEAEIEWAKPLPNDIG